MAKSKSISPATLAMMEQIKPLWELGLSGTEIAHRLGKTKNAIAGLLGRHAEKMGIARRKAICFDDVATQMERLERIKPHYEAGLPYEGIGRLVGISGEAVRGVVKRHGHKVGLTVRSPRPWNVSPTEGGYCPPKSGYGNDKTGGAQEVVEARAAVAAFQKAQRTEIVAPKLTVVYTSSLPLQHQCQFPMWRDNERPRFLSDGSPFMCLAPSMGVYCVEHRAICYSRERRAAA